SPLEVLELLLAETPEDARSAAEIVADYWQAQHEGDDFDAFWQAALHDGLVAGSAPSPQEVAAPDLSNLPPPAEPAAPEDGSTLEIHFRPDPTIWDGRFANNGWLQELPKPLTKLTWDNAAFISPLTADSLGLTQGDVVELEYQGRTAQAAIWLMPGHAA